MLILTANIKCSKRIRKDRCAQSTFGISHMPRFLIFLFKIQTKHVFLHLNYLCVMVLTILYVGIDDIITIYLEINT